ncbi:hypothetical protein MML48_2g00012757 [Holotrichia oblita]|uniref:Uncharacterized protein n=2 Tax=Holotrichia oblita TaxID=644536 RepID=A0ACB9TK13_HOLOL|nr:hypothetical protein MML48_2g00006601 [Holotrichia oblita]KAI4467103.1 hypothetical protein MML48_2g00012757 [Holotrichia oblita]
MESEKNTSSPKQQELQAPKPFRPKNMTISPSSKNDDLEENDDEMSQQMTASYSEISFKSGLSPENEVNFSLSLDPGAEYIKRPVTLCDRTNKHLGALTLEGTVHVEGNMTHFVAEDLEYKIKLSSPQAKKGDGNTMYKQISTPQVGHIDINFLNDLESEAQHLATSVDNLTENLCGILHSISSITADNVDVYKNAVSKMSDDMDANIKSMYTMMAKAEEVTQTMKSVQAHSVRIKEIKRLVDLFESYI